MDKISIKAKISTEANDIIHKHAELDNRPFSNSLEMLIKYGWLWFNEKRNNK